jgi:hypothetical protein
MADARREYRVDFSIGAKLQASFRGVTAFAQARLKNLQHVAMATASVLKKLVLGVGALGAVFGGFLIGGLIKKLFGDAADAAVEADIRVAHLTATFQKFGGITKEVAAGQVEKLNQIAEGYEKQGALSHVIFENLAAGMADVGLYPKLIAKAVGPMGDLLAYSKDIRATPEDAKNFANALGKALQGNARGLLRLREFGIKMTKSQTDEFKKLKDPVKALEYIVTHFADKPGVKGFNKALLDTSRGRMMAFQNTLHKMAEELGRAVLPLRDRLTDVLRKNLPDILPVLIGGINALGTVVRAVTDTLEGFKQAWAMPKGVEAWNTLADSFGRLAISLGIASPDWKTFGEAVGKFAVDQAPKLAKEIDKLTQRIEAFRNSFGGIPDFGALLFALQTMFKVAEAEFEKFDQSVHNFLIAPFRAWSDEWQQAVNAFKNYDWKGLLPWNWGGSATPPAPAVPAIPPSAVNTFKNYDWKGLLPWGGSATPPAPAVPAIPPSSAPGAATTNVSFAPNITINGNATVAEQKALDQRLRSLASTFVDQFKAAQYQERRLSYEAGYV